MKPYGQRSGDASGVAWADHGSGPRGKNKARKLHDERRLIHRQGRQDERAEIRAEIDNHENNKHETD
jgi:hypothetical protein